MLKSCVYKDFFPSDLQREEDIGSMQMCASKTEESCVQKGNYKMHLLFCFLGFFSPLFVILARFFMFTNFFSSQKGRFQIRAQKSKMVTGFCFGTDFLCLFWLMCALLSFLPCLGLQNQDNQLSTNKIIHIFSWWASGHDF